MLLPNKLEDLTGLPKELLHNLTPDVIKRVELLREIQCQHDELEAKFLEEKAAREAKYQKLYQPLYTKRFDIVNGVVEVDSAVAEASAVDREEYKDAVRKGVPNFWLNAMKNNDEVAWQVSKRDKRVLKLLTDIRWSRINSPKSFKLEFFFDTNPYFRNTVLTKTYHMIDEDEPILEKCIGTEIEWYPGKCVTEKVIKMKPRKGSKSANPITTVEKFDSFFDFFSPPEIPEDKDDLDGDDPEQLRARMEQDYDIASAIRYKIIPHAVSWFTGEAVEDEFAAEDEDDDSNSDDDDNSNSDDDDDLDDDDEDEETWRM